MGRRAMRILDMKPGETAYTQLSQLRCLELSRIIRTGLPGIEFDMGVVRNTCGTAGCIAGFAVAVYERSRWDAGGFHSDHAARLLGLSSRQADELFFPVSTEGMGACSGITADQAANALESVVFTGKVRWEK